MREAILGRRYKLGSHTVEIVATNDRGVTFKAIGTNIRTVNGTVTWQEFSRLNLTEDAPKASTTKLAWKARPNVHELAARLRTALAR
jgi:hypothetical protein